MTYANSYAIFFIYGSFRKLCCFWSIIYILNHSTLVNHYALTINITVSIPIRKAAIYANTALFIMIAPENETLRQRLF
jgi:hypothetical protein